MSETDLPRWQEYKDAVDKDGFIGQYYDWFAKQANISLTTERKSTHGDWKVQSKIFIRLMSVLESSPNWATLEHHQKAALINIAQKISRIASGQPDEPDHWDDIGGYALLGKSGHA